MKVMIFSDVHGNLPALDIALADAGGDVDAYVCLGDAVDYGPWSNECVDRIIALPNSIYINGNHEQDFIKGSHTGDNPIANAFFDFCYPRFNRFQEITDLPVEYTMNDFVFTHTIEDRNIYPDSDLTIERNYVIGHSHHQFWIEQNGFRLYNSGSIGQNRKYINIINYLILDTETMQFEMRGLTYDHSVVIAEMKRLGYPDMCTAYYEDKQVFKGKGPLVPLQSSTIL